MSLCYSKLFIRDDVFGSVCEDVGPAIAAPAFDGEAPTTRSAKDDGDRPSVETADPSSSSPLFFFAAPSRNSGSGDAAAAPRVP